MSSRWGKRKNSLRGSQNKFLAHHRPSHLDDILRMTLQYRGRRDHAARFLCSSLPKDITLRISEMMLLFLFLLFLFFFLERYHHRNHPSTPFKAFKKNGPPARMPKTADSATNVVSSLPTSPCSSSSPPVHLRKRMRVILAVLLGSTSIVVASKGECESTPCDTGIEHKFNDKKSDTERWLV